MFFTKTPKILTTKIFGSKDEYRTLAKLHGLQGQTGRASSEKSEESDDFLILGDLPATQEKATPETQARGLQAPTKQVPASTSKEDKIAPAHHDMEDEADFVATFTEVVHKDELEGGEDDLAVIPNAEHILGAETNDPGVVSRGVATSARGAATVAGVVSNAASNLANTPKLGTMTLQAASHAMYEDIMKFNVADPNDYTSDRVFKVLRAGAAAAGATLVGTAASKVQGHDIIDHEATIENAEKYLRQAGNGFTAKQQDTITGWIAEARRLLKEFTTEGRISRDASAEVNASPLATSGANRDEEKKQPGKEGEAPKAGVSEPTKLSTPPAPPPRIQVQNSEGGTTLANYVETSKNMAKLRNPDAATMQAHAKELHSVLEALKKFTEVPYKVSVVSDSDVSERSQMRQHRAWGAKKFKDALLSRALTFAENSRSPDDKQNKMFMHAISGPGTAKTTGIKLMARWSKMPICIYSGSDFKAEVKKRQKEDPSVSVTDVLVEWMSDQAMNGMRMDKNGMMQSENPKESYINGLFLFDDWHVALDADPKRGDHGPLYTDRAARKKFFDLCGKHFADANFQNMLSVELAEGRHFPLNTSRMQVIMTSNTMPNELKQKTELDDDDEQDDGRDMAVLDRTMSLNPDYADANDRQDLARQEFFEPFLDEIAQRRGWTREFLNKTLRPDLGIKYLKQVVDVDAKIAKERFGGTLGTRALPQLVQQYINHVKKKIDTHDGPEMFSFDGATPLDSTFDPDLASDKITSYNRDQNANMSSADLLKKISERLTKIKAQANGLLQRQSEPILKILDKLEKIEDDDQGLKIFGEIEERLAQYERGVQLPSLQEADGALTQLFGYLRSDGSEGEADRFADLAKVATDIYFRLVAASKAVKREEGEPEPALANRVVRVKFSDPRAWDPTVYANLAKALGGIPVHFLTQPGSLMGEGLDLPGFEEKPKPAAKPGVPRVDVMPYDMQGQMGMGVNVAAAQGDDPIEKGNILVRYPARFRYQRPGGGMQNIRMTAEKVTLGKKVYFGVTLGKNEGQTQHYLMTQPAIDKCVEEIMDNHDFVEVNEASGFVKLEGSGSLQQAITEATAPRLSFLEDYAKSVNGKPASQAFIVGVLNDSVRTAINNWRSINTGLSADKSTRELFEQHIYETLNKREITLKDGSTLDPEGITVFLVDDIENPDKNVIGLDSGENTLTMTMGIPPLEGRRTRAEHALQTAMEAAKKNSAVYRSLLNQQESEGTELTPEETAVFEALVTWDYEQAVRSRSIDYALPPKLLDDAVNSFAKHVSGNSGYTLGALGGSKLPSIEGFKTQWREIYSQDLDYVDTAISAIEARKRAKAKADAIAAEAKAKEDKARAAAKAKAKAKNESEHKATSSDTQGRDAKIASPRPAPISLAPTLDAKTEEDLQGLAIPLIPPPRTPTVVELTDEQAENDWDTSESKSE